MLSERPIAAFLRRLPMAVFAGGLLWALAAAAAESFLSGTEDLPVMPGLTESPGTMVFGTPGGRILEAFASGRVTADQVQSFYAATLPQLGWLSQGKGVYRRENEVLKLDVVRPGPPLVVRFTLSPE
jgi:hypothetical protein